jgi:hypothetical protein
MAERVTGKVARVTSDRELIINRGSEHGVAVGMVFRVKGSPVDVIDPDTNQSIGTVARVKVVVRVVEVDIKFSIARTFRSSRVNVGGEFVALPSLSQVLQPPKWETRYETLRKDPDKGEYISGEESVVAVGDIVEEADDDDLDAAATTLYR